MSIEFNDCHVDLMVTRYKSAKDALATLDGSWTTIAPKYEDTLYVLKMEDSDKGFVVEAVRNEEGIQSRRVIAFRHATGAPLKGWLSHGIFNYIDYSCSSIALLGDGVSETIFPKALIGIYKTIKVQSDDHGKQIDLVPTDLKGVQHCSSGISYICEDDRATLVFNNAVPHTNAIESARTFHAVLGSQIIRLVYEPSVVGEQFDAGLSGFSFGNPDILSVEYIADSMPSVGVEYHKATGRKPTDLRCVDVVFREVKEHVFYYEGLW